MTVLITGDTSGIGRALKIQFSTKHKVLGFGHLKCDLTKYQSIKKYVKSLPEIDLLFCNAGLYITKPFIEHTKKDWDSLFAVNVTGHYLLIQELAKQKKLSWGATIAIISSDMLYRMPGNQIAYNCSKAALEVLGATIGKEIPLSRVYVLRIPAVYTKQLSMINIKDTIPEVFYSTTEIAEYIIKLIGGIE